MAKAFDIWFQNAKSQFTDKKEDSLNMGYKNRTVKLVEQIKRRKPRIVGFCECGPDQALLIQELLGEEYQVFGFCSGEKGKEFHISLEELKQLLEKGENPYVGEFYLIAVDKSIDLLKVEYVAFPDGGRHARGGILSTLSLGDQTWKVLVLHADHILASQRKLVFQQLKKMMDDNWIVMGDFNNFSDGEPQNALELFSHTNYRIASSSWYHRGPKGTFIGDGKSSWSPRLLARFQKNGRMVREPGSDCIDWIVYSKAKLKVKKSTHIMGTMVYNKEFPLFGDPKSVSEYEFYSDHVGVYAEFCL
jgi:hypothetical protein